MLCFLCLLCFLPSDMRQDYNWVLPRKTLTLGKRTAIMGILNVTPDSFSDGGLYSDPDKAVARAIEMEQDGADIIDVGGESSRPGSQAVPENEELGRVLPAIERMARAVKIPLSIDTYRATVAERAIEAGAQIVNDISSFRFDARMQAVVNRGRAGIVLMHSRGDRDTLHKQEPMNDPIREVALDLSAAAEHALAAGIPREAIILDPGIGFGKTAAESVTILKSLEGFSKIGYPLLVGTSRKSFIRLLTSDQTQESRIWGTAATVIAAIMSGAHIVRVHDVRQTRVLADVADRLLN
jgi:dihydropteroate synthase